LEQQLSLFTHPTNQFITAPVTAKMPKNKYGFSAAGRTWFLAFHKARWAKIKATRLWRLSADVG